MVAPTPSGRLRPGQLANQQRPEIQPHGRLETDKIRTLPPDCDRGAVSSRDQYQIGIFVACFDQYAWSEAVHTGGGFPVPNKTTRIS